MVRRMMAGGGDWRRSLELRRRRRGEDLAFVDPLVYEMMRRDWEWRGWRRRRRREEDDLDWLRTRRRRRRRRRGEGPFSDPLVFERKTVVWKRREEDDLDWLRRRRRRGAVACLGTIGLAKRVVSMRGIAYRNRVQEGS